MILEYLNEYSIDEGYIQEPSDNDEWLSDLDSLRVFESSLFRPIWHWKQENL